MIYFAFAFAYPHILYGIEMYANTGITHLNKIKLAILNNKILQILQKKTYTVPVRELYNNYYTLPIPELQYINVSYFCWFINVFTINNYCLEFIMITFITIKIHMLLILETKLIFTCLALIVPSDKDVLNIKEHCYGINS